MENTGIEWATHTFNGWEGCTKVSAGCKNCYAETRNARWNGGTAPNWGKGAPRRRTSVANWRKPVQWNKAAEAERQRIDRHNLGADIGQSIPIPPKPRVFCASLADWLDDEVPIEWLKDLLVLIFKTPHLEWMLLSKRPENFVPRLHKVILECKFSGEELTAHSTICKWAGEDIAPGNVWIGTSAEDQENWDRRIPHLMEIPAKIRFVSAEPLLGPITMGLVQPDWLIVGGESGPGARPMEKQWVRNLEEESGMSCFFFFKQWGGTNKKATGRELDGKTFDEVPKP